MDIPVNRLVRLLQPDRPAEVRAAAVLVLGELGVRDPAVAAGLVALAGDKKHPLPPAAGFPVVRVLAALNVPAADEVLWDRVLPPHPPEVRAAALQAVGGRVEKATREQWRKLFACAAEPDFRVA